MPGPRGQGRILLLVLGILALTILSAAVAVGWRLSSERDEVSPWLYCTTNPCQPLGLFPLPTPPALSNDPSLAAACDLAGAPGSQGILRWHTDWDPLVNEGQCVSRDEAGLDDG